MIDDEFHRHPRIDDGGIPSALRHHIAQACEIDQSREPEDVVADDAMRMPDVAIPPPERDLLERRLAFFRGSLAQHVLGEDAGGVGQLGEGPRPARLERGAHIVEAVGRLRKQANELGGHGEGNGSSKPEIIA